MRKKKSASGNVETPSVQPQKAGYLGRASNALKRLQFAALLTIVLSTGTWLLLNYATGVVPLRNRDVLFIVGVWFIVISMINLLRSYLRKRKSAAAGRGAASD